MGEGRDISETKRRLLDMYLRGSAAATAAKPAVTRRPAGEPAPASLSQEQLWLREKMSPSIPLLYNECVVLRMLGSIDVPALECSMAEIVRRHEIWRTSYDTISGQLVQIVHPPLDNFSLRPIDLRSLPGARGEAEAERMISNLVRQRFDLAEGPLLRGRLLRIRDYEYRLCLCAHLSVVDGVSVYRVFPSELAALYQAISAGRSSPLPDLEVQFGDYAYWQRQSWHGEEEARQRSYWRQQLSSELPVLAWPPARRRTSRQTFRGKIRPFLLPAVCNLAARDLSHREGVTLFMTLLGTYAALLYQYAQQADIIIGTLSPAGRKRSEVEALLGYFLNPVALRFDLRGNPTFRDLLRQAQKLTLEAITNDDVPLEHLNQELGIDHPFFTAAISLQPPTPRLDVEWSITSMDVESGGSPWSLYLVFIDRPGEMIGRVQYNPDLFDNATVTCLVQDFHRMLEKACARPDQRLSDLSVLFSTELWRRQG